MVAICNGGMLTVSIVIFISACDAKIHSPRFLPKEADESKTSVWFTTVGGEGSGHHGYCGSGFLDEFARGASNESFLFPGIQESNFLMDGHMNSSHHRDYVRGSWFSDLGHKWGNSSRIQKINVEELHREVRATYLDHRGYVKIRCNTAYPGAHEFGGIKKKLNKGGGHHGTDWFLDFPEVVEYLEHGNNFKKAFETLTDEIDATYPTDPRQQILAMAAFSSSVKMKFMFTIRSLPIMIASHSSFDGGACRHGLVMTSIITYFDRIARELPEDSWRVLWYTSMSNTTARTNILENLVDWLGWNPKAIKVGDSWHSSSRGAEIDSKNPLYFFNQVQNWLVLNGNLSTLLKTQNQLDIGGCTTQIELMTLNSQWNRLPAPLNFTMDFTDVSGSPCGGKWYT